MNKFNIKIIFVYFLMIGYSWADVNYTPKNGIKFNVDRFFTPTSDYYFVIENNEVYMTTIKNPKKNIQKLTYKNHQFQLQKGVFQLKSQLKYPTKEMNRLIEKDFDEWKMIKNKHVGEAARVLLREENRPGCVPIQHYIRPDTLGYGGIDGEEWEFLNKGLLDLKFDYVQHLQCDANGHAFGVIIQCGARNCTQYAIGFDVN